MEIDLEELRGLMRSMQQFGVHELEWARGERRIALKMGGALAAAAPPAPSAPLLPASQPAIGNRPGAQPLAPAEEVADSDEGEFITSPFVGTFYRSPSPEAPSFVEAGQRVKTGQSLCIVEAMKLMNEIEAEFECTIEEVLVESGKAVEFGDRLFRVRRGS